jgi:S-adenosylmethionine:tRNA ribosyltransferase-isomerase
MELPQINMGDFWYDLPDERIAKYPLAQRDQSKLLYWNGNGPVHEHFYQLPDHFSGNEVLFFNNTKVIPARLYFRKETGALIEIFLLGPIAPAVVDVAMLQTAQCDWACTIGNLKTWKNGIVLERTLEIAGQNIQLSAALLDAPSMHVRFTWTGNLPLTSILEAAGQTPIPPYLQRAAEESDRHTYQTVYSKKDGAVAAPTAGLHFTPEIMGALAHKGVDLQEVTLHVSAGTFKPVKVENAMDHDMHFEQVVVRRTNVEALLHGKKVVCVGTTAMRTLESLYWYGLKLLLDKNAACSIEKTDAYTLPAQFGAMPTVQAAMTAILEKMDAEGQQELQGITQLYIMPGYTFRVCEVLVTNFHQPGSTLLLLVAAFIGEKNWRTVYDAAMASGYRFLSYGDSSYLLKRSKE